MNPTLNYSSGSLYYRHSGKISPGLLLLAVAVGSAAALLLGAIYAYVEVYNPIAGWITVLLTLGVGWGQGLIIKNLIKSCRVRNTPIAVTLAVFLVLVFYVSSWEFWFYAFLQRVGNPVEFTVLLHPSVAWELLTLLYEHGAHAIKGTEISGPFLLLLWLIEAGVVLGIPVHMAWNAVREVPFCEKCGKWCGIREIMNFNPGDKPMVIRRLEAKDFSVLTDLGMSPPTSMHFWHATFQGCPHCDTTQTLCLSDIVLTYNNKGQLQTKRKPLLTQLILSPEDVVAVATAAASLSAALVPSQAQAVPAAQSASGEIPSANAAALPGQTQAPGASDMGPPVG